MRLILLLLSVGGSLLWLLVGLWKSLGWIRWAPTRVDLLKKLCPPRTHDAR